MGTLIEKLTSPDVNLSPEPVKNADGSIRYPGLDNHGMGSIFEELLRRFNEENNEEAGEHWTPRDAVRLMAKLVFLPVADEIKSGTYLLYDGACGSGGMLTVAEETLRQLATEHGKDVSTHLFGQEINAETYAICKADLLLKGEGAAADNIVGGPEHSTLAHDAFPSREFDFMLSNPPYGKTWKIDLERMGGKKDMRDPRFVIDHAGDAEYSLVTRSSDGQMLFLANKLSKMKQGTPLGSRIAEVHNGSSLFTGDAGQGESNIRRWIIENDWLEAIVALPLNMFYNTGIATYVWVLTNRKPEHRRGKVSCQKCGYALSRASGRSSARRIHYYRCIGSDGWRHLGGPRCDTRPVRQDLLDEVVWTEVIRLLEEPALIQQEMDRRLAAAQAADPTKKRTQAVERDLARVGKSMERLLTAYQEDLLSLEQLRERMPLLRQREQTLRDELNALVEQTRERAAHLRLAETLSAFLTRLRAAAETLDIVERQRIVRLVVKEVLVNDDTIVIRHCIPVPSGPPPTNDGGPNNDTDNAADPRSYLLRSGSNRGPLRRPLPLPTRPVRPAATAATVVLLHRHLQPRLDPAQQPPVAHAPGDGLHQFRVRNLAEVV